MSNLPLWLRFLLLTAATPLLLPGSPLKAGDDDAGSPFVVILAPANAGINSGRDPSKPAHQSDTAMHHFHYRDGTLYAENISLAAIAADVGTPFYAYSTATLERHYEVLAEAFSGMDALICFAVKANSNQAVLATMARLGAGMDVVSEGELRRARAAGVPANKIIFAGVGKTREEMAYALQEGILGFNVESEPELHALSDVAQSLGKTAKVAIRSGRAHV